MIKNVNIENETKVSSIINSKEKVDLTFYCRDNIPRYQTISSIPKNHIEYFKSILPINMESMFCDCRYLFGVNLSGIDTSLNISMKNMFKNCNYIFYNGCIDLHMLITDNILSTESMFEVMNSGPEVINLSNWNLIKNKSMKRMFYNCSKLIDLNMENIDTKGCEDFSEMFYNCRKLISINTTLDFSSCINVKGMFRYSGLKNLHLKNVPRSLLDIHNEFIDFTGGTLNETYIIDNILEDK